MRPVNQSNDDQKLILTKEAEKYLEQKLYRLALKKYQKIIALDTSDSITQRKIKELSEVLKNQSSKEKKLFIISVVVILAIIVIYAIIVNA